MTRKNVEYVRAELQRLADLEGEKPLARRLNVPFGKLRSLLAGRDPLTSSLAKVSEALGMEFYVGPVRNNHSRHEPMVIDSTEYDNVPLFGAVDAAAGGGAEVLDETKTGSVAFRSEWLKSRNVQPKHAVMIQVRGDSMKPTINDRDLILVNTKVTGVANGKVHVVRHEGGLYVKRLTRFGKMGVLMASDNPEYAPVLIPAADFAPGSIVGRAIWSGGDIGETSS